jgi:hypothetical protein
MEMEMKEEYRTTAAEEKTATVVKSKVESAQGKGTAQENTPVYKAPKSPAPFYDELHFADYE